MIDDFILGLAAIAFGGVLVVMALPARSRIWRQRSRPNLPPETEPGIHRIERWTRRVLATVSIVVGLAVAAGGLVTVVAALFGLEFGRPLTGTA